MLQVGNGARRFRLVLGELCHLNEFLDDLFRGRVGERGGLGVAIYKGPP